MPWRPIASNTVSAARQVGLSPLVGVGGFDSSAGPVASQVDALDSGEYRANAFPGKPDVLPYAPVIIATWFGLVSAIITERDSR